MNKDIVAFGFGFFTAGGTAIGVIATVPNPTVAQWLIAVFGAFAGGFGGVMGKSVNVNADKREQALKAVGAAEQAATTLASVVSAAPVPVTVTNPMSDPVPTTDSDPKGN